MSGGHYDYIQYRFNEAADQLEQDIINCEKSNKDDWNNFSQETINKFKEALVIIKKSGIMLHRIDWLLSGDDGEEDFHERLKEDLEKINV